ncbi:MAG: SLOG family protein [Candidatus Tenebribacter mawsonii]|nr:SLOG family protein [Candidatus Tenebribacter mawsonii]
MKLAVIGTKKFTDYIFLSSILKKIPNIEIIISGGAIGTDTLAKQFAIQNNIELKEFPPDYKKFGDKAKHIRDKLIAKECDELIAFWDGECDGTKYTIDYAEQLGKTIEIIQVINN